MFNRAFFFFLDFLSSTSLGKVWRAGPEVKDDPLFFDADLDESTASSFLDGDGLIFRLSSEDLWSKVVCRRALDSPSIL